MLDQVTRLLDFPTLGTMTYLNTAAEGIPPPAVGEALADHVRDKQRGTYGAPSICLQLDVGPEACGPTVRTLARRGRDLLVQLGGV